MDALPLMMMMIGWMIHHHSAHELFVILVGTSRVDLISCLGLEFCSARKDSTLRPR
jgi:hypothetical protein